MLRTMILKPSNTWLSLLIWMVTTLMMLVTLFARTSAAAPLTTNRSTPATLNPALLEQFEKFFGNISTDCTSHHCDEKLNINYLLNVQKYINPEVDPCTDFFEYTCGNFEKEFPTGTNMYTYASISYRKTLANILDRVLTETKNEDSRTKKNALPKFYKSCSLLEEPPKLNSYLHHLRENENLWRFGQSGDWILELGKLGRFGYSSHFIQYYVKSNKTTTMLELYPHGDDSKLRWTEEIYEALKEYTQKESEQLRMELEEFETNLTSELYGLKAFVNYLLEVVEYEDSNIVSALEANRYEEVVSILEDDNASEDDSATIESSLTVDELSAETEDMVDWSLYLSTILDRPVQPTEKISIKDLDAIKRVISFLNRSDSEIVQLYSMARFLQYLQDRHDLIFKYGDIRVGCSSFMVQTLPILTNYAYSMWYYHAHAESVSVIREIFDKLRNEFKKVLEENAMNFKKKELDFLIEKLGTMRLRVGDLPENVTRRDYDEYASNLEISESDFSSNHLQALRLYTKYSNHLIGMKNQSAYNPLYLFHLSTPLKDLVSGTPFYREDSNTVTLPFDYVLPPNYSEQFWDILLYGELAGSLGHEIIHAFDYDSLESGDHGLELGKVSSDIIANSNFSANIDCLKKGTQFLSERIADVSGFHLVLRAFRDEVTKTRAQSRLFFVLLGQFLCTSKKYLKSSYYKRHDIDNVRLNYAVAQLPEFAHAFECPPGRKMNPETRCHLW